MQNKSLKEMKGMSNKEVKKKRERRLRTKHYIMTSMLLYWRRQWHPAPVLLPGKSHGWRSLVGYSPSGCYESDTTE